MPQLNKKAQSGTRIATVCVLGPKAKRVEANEGRGALLQAIVKHLRQEPLWQPIDALLLPGGYFRLKPYIGHLSHERRVAMVERASFHRTAMAALAALELLSPSLLIVAGVDSDSPSKHDVGDQLCVAWGGDGIVGIGRKVFPVDGDTNVEGRPYICHATDFATRQRYVRLANGRTAILGACYDLFGLSETVEQPTARTRYIRFIQDGAAVRSIGDPGFAALRRQLIGQWHRTLLEESPTVALGAIHKFGRPGRDLFWQRHGIAQASAALRGGLAFGAAHFLERLPEGTQSALAAVAVPSSHLHHGQHRRAQAHLPCRQAEVAVRWAPMCRQALCRLITLARFARLRGWGNWSRPG